MRQFKSQVASSMAAITTTLFVSILLLIPLNQAFTINPTTTTYYELHSAQRTTSRLLARQPSNNSNNNNKYFETNTADNDDKPTPTSPSSSSSSSISSRRRHITSQIASATSTAFLLLSLEPQTARAGIDVSSLKNLPVEKDVSGAATRLKQLQQQGTTIEGEESTRASLFSADPYDLPSVKVGSGGVSYREVKKGRDGSRAVQRGSTIGVELSIRAKSIATPSNPGGSKLFSTKDDTYNNELVWTIGSGDFVKGVEDGMMGMKLNAVRLIEVPSMQIFAARNAGVLPDPTTGEGKRIYEEAFRSDATFVFEVFVTAINQGNNRI